MRGLYTTNLTDDLEAVVARNLWKIVDLLAPGTVIAYRTAFEMRPGERARLSGWSGPERD